jgi:MYXO-CTERM domain-containing protein
MRCPVPRSFPTLALTSALALVALAPPAAAIPYPHQPTLPKWETPEERSRPADAVFRNAQFRTDHPELYAITAPPVTPVRIYAEHEAVTHVYTVWYPGEEDDFFWGIVSNVVQHGDAAVGLIVESAQHQSQLEDRIVAYHGSVPAGVEFVNLGSYPHYGTYALDSFWTIDFGPFWVQDGNDNLGILDPRYYFDRVNDDAVPTKMGDLLDLTVWRPDLDLEGGNLMSDGDGTCFLSWAHLIRNAWLLPYQVDEILYDYFGCDQTIWVQPLIGERTGHIDMFARLTGPTTAIVGEYQGADDPENAAVLDENAARIAATVSANGEPFTVVRIPMPDNSNRSVWRTYTNGILVNDLVLIPTYANAPTHEADAIAAWEQAAPGRTVIGLRSDRLIPSGGAIHCVTRTRPTATAAAIEAAPADLCNGDWQCVTGCGDLDYDGECIGNTSVYCQDGEVAADDCGSQTCGWDATNRYADCIDPGCGAITAAGQCETLDSGVEFAVRCVGDVPRAARCPPTAPCAPNASLGYVTCGTGAACFDACATGETGCTGDQAWTCGEAGDGDDCLDRILVDCPGGCLDGACEPPPCTDACTTGDTGCSGDLSQAWTCGEAGDGDDCLDHVLTDCPHGCVNGACSEEACTDECTAGTGGCEDTTHLWSCGEAGDGDACTDRVVTACGQGQTCVAGTCQDPEPPVLTPSDGCSCSTRPDGSAGLWLLVIGLALLRRRRRG